MASHSRKRIRQLFEEAVEEKTYFEYRFSLDGTMVREREEIEPADLRIYIDEDSDFYREDETVVFKFDAKAKRQLSKTFRRILKTRKIPSLESITLTHQEVYELIGDYADANNLKRKDVDENVKERIRQEVVSKYEPEYQIALYEIVLLTMVERDLFKPSKIRGNKFSLETKMDVEIPEDFWTSQSPVKEDDEDDKIFDEFKFGTYIEELKPIARSQNDRLEYMIAFVDTLILENDALSDVASELAKVVVANVFVSANREAVVEDGLEPFRQRLEKLLPSFMGGGNDDVNGSELTGGISISVRTYGNESSGQEGNAPISGDTEFTPDDTRAES